jgi:hypothetical protein
MQVRGLNVLISSANSHRPYLYESTVDDVFDAFNRDTCFGDIGCKDDFACIPRRRLKDECLFFGGQTSMQRQRHQFRCGAR